ncbi:MAG: (4Fe-4S)-binding protein [Dietzia sp.]
MTRKTYTGRYLNVSFDGELCRHAAECVRGMPDVFDPSRRPWIDPGQAATEEDAERLRRVIGRCPSGALEAHEVESAGSAPTSNP